ncbi:MAG: ABC transporter permease [Anaerolineae bacterium]|nr:ABC transporter permease [Anaerolineae bacterium]
MQFLSRTLMFRNSARLETPIFAPPERRVIQRLAPFLTVLLILIAWQLVSTLALVPDFLIPAPLTVFDQFVEVIADGRLAEHTLVTLGEVVSGLIVGVLVGVTLGYLIARLPLLEDLLSPLIVSLQSTPVVAYAPLLVIWFGSGPTGKMITSALIVFFPMLMNTVVGIRSVPRNLRDLMLVARASRWQTLTRLEIPAALPILLTGLKTAATLSVVGAVVGEYINASAGLGFMINQARSQFDTPLVFVGMITLSVMARLLYSTVALLERRLLAWKQF